MAKDNRSLPIAGPAASPEERAEGGGLSRRRWLELMGASLALAGLSGCTRQPLEKIMPYTIAPTGVVPGIPRFYATSMTLDGYAVGLLVESHEGRPTKVEGNPGHPASLGAAGIHEQASVLGLYDPDRANAVRSVSGPTTWEAFANVFGRPRDDGGKALRFWLDAETSPLVLSMIRKIRERHPEARFVHHRARGDAAERGAELAFGRRALPQYDFTKAKVVLALDSDFAGIGPNSLRWARELADGRRVATPGAPMSRLYAVECEYTPTGSLADHRLGRTSREVTALAAAIASKVLATKGGPNASGALQGTLARFPIADEDRRFVDVVARDLVSAGPAAVVVVGYRQPAEIHAVAYLVNAALASDAAWLTEPVLIDEGGMGEAELLQELRDHRVDTLVILGHDPAQTTPADWDFAGLLREVPNSVYLTLLEDATSAHVKWLLPQKHYLETWGDARAYDGTVSLVQPLIAPLFPGKTAAEVLAMMAGVERPIAYDLLRASFFERAALSLVGAADAPEVATEAQLREAIQRGFLPGTAEPPLRLTPKPAALEQALGALADQPPPAHGTLEINFVLDPKLGDGRFANNAWLQELPAPMTHLTWDNAAYVGPRTARALDVGKGDVVAVELGGRSVDAPILVVPGLGEGAVVLQLGYGRIGMGRVGNGVGFDAGAIRTSGAPWSARGTVRRTGRRYALAVTQEHTSQHGREIALEVTAADYAEKPFFASEHRGPVPSLLPPNANIGYQWAMAIDMGLCSGCSACVVACQAENNLLVVGKKNVMNSREMHWIRIDGYIEPDAKEPRVIHQPMLCQHCEKAPCEYVCPVNATVHSPDGLNEMVYNRCVGTRFCSNNCPYKVRRFNFLDYVAEQPANDGLIRLQRNPEVTLRDRGVMEKCTYCVQRIRTTEIHARIEGREIGKGEIQTACQQACPTHAITFDSLSHADAEVVAWRAEPRSYSVLHETGAQPRTQYLARVRNPNPELL